MPRCAVVLRLLTSALCVLGAWQTMGRAADEPRSDGPISYERHVRPLLKTHCFHCHGEGEELAGGLDVRLRRALVQGGESGPAVAPGQPDESLLLQRLRDGDMPPEEVQVRPTARDIELIQRWISEGAVTLRDEPERIDAGWYVTEEERNFWAFVPVVRPALPQVRDATRVQTPIDRFVLARLEQQGLTFSEEAERGTLIRRVSLDLLGLPPSPDEVRQFVTDPAPDAYPRLVDRLLASPRYGERWGRHWLDVAGYADSEGATDDDVERPNAYKYRDYVVDAMNRDKPFDQFVREQLAGDEMVNSPAGDLCDEDIEKLVATGFLRMAPDGTASANPEPAAARNQVVADTIQIVSTSLLGLTVACAQCHNHRYDPIAQADYYRLRAILEPALNCNDWKPPQARRVSLYTDADRRLAAEIEKQAKEIERQRDEKQKQFIQQTFEAQLAKLPEAIREPIRMASDTPPAKRTAEQKKLLKDNPSVNVTAGSLYLYDSKAAAELKRIAEQAANVRAKKPKEEYLRALTETAGRTPPETFVFIRGDYQQPGEPIAPGELEVLRSDASVTIPLDDPDLPSTGRRLTYARWLTSGKHPLTARVQVNRLWQHHFGRGLVETAGDFGMLGDRPSHPELLDWLADELVRDGWSLKQLHRMILLSSVYRQDSRRTPRLDEVDADNRLLGRMSVRRLEAEVIRDMMLDVSGMLNTRQGGPPVPVMADQVGQFVLGIENLNAGRPGPVIPLKGEEYRRSLYTQVRRSRPLSVLEAFDAPTMDPNCTNRAASTVAPQSLMLMNSELVIDLARHFAQRVAREAAVDPADRVGRAWWLAYGRAPDKAELDRGLQFLHRRTEDFAAVKGSTDKADKDPKAAERLPPETEALAALCHVLLSSNAFLYVD
jgi:hypothetical protein